MHIYIDRWAIYDDRLDIAGYEIHQAQGQDSAYTRGLLCDAQTYIGLEALCNYLPVFVRLTPAMLADGFPWLTAPGVYIFALEADGDYTQALADDLRRLRADGYRLALRGYTGQTLSPALQAALSSGVFEILCVPVRRRDRASLQAILAGDLERASNLMAEEVRTADDLELAVAFHFTYFSGPYFSPNSSVSKPLPRIQDAACGRFLRHVQSQGVLDPELCLAYASEDLLLRYLLTCEGGFSPALWGRDAIGQQLAALPREVLLHSGCAAVLQAFCDPASPVTPRQAFRRGLFVEALLRHADTELDPDSGFLIGVFSCMYQMSIEALRLREEITRAVDGHAQSPYSDLLQFVMIYELLQEQHVEGLLLPELPVHLRDTTCEALYLAADAKAQRLFASVQLSSRIADA